LKLCLKKQRGNKTNEEEGREGGERKEKQGRRRGRRERKPLVMTTMLLSGSSTFSRNVFHTGDFPGISPPY
jgi:hypothetical protein